MPAVAAVRASDSISGKPGPWRIAEPRRGAITPETHGTWTDLTDGGRLWRLRVHAAGATDLNFGFTRFHLPGGASLYVISDILEYYEGPYTHEDNEELGYLATKNIDDLAESYLGTRPYPLRDPAGEIRVLYKVQPTRIMTFGPVEG